MTPDPSFARRDATLVAGVHIVLALVYWLGFGVSIVHDFGPDKFGWFAKNLATDLLREQAVESIWYMHVQPPPWNVLGAIFIQAFGSLHMPMLQLLHIAMGASIAAIGVRVVAQSTGSRKMALGARHVRADHAYRIRHRIRPQHRAAGDRLVNCGYCGRNFEEDRGQKACAECPLGSSCGHIMCPYCGFENPATPGWMTFLQKRFGKKKGAQPPPPSQPRPGDLPVIHADDYPRRRSG